MQIGKVVFMPRGVPMISRNDGGRQSPPSAYKQAAAF
jgi:hypothetical protein